MESVKNESISKIIFILAAFAILTLAALFVGRYSIDLDILLGLFSKSQAMPEIARARSVLFQIRLPRVLAAIIIGAALSVAGSSYQAIFRNPMVSPAILGASSGSAFGASLAILIGMNFSGIQLFAFISGLIAVAITIGLSSLISAQSRSILIIILSGMLVSTLFSSLISLIKFVADPYSKLPDITFWILGSLSAIELSETITIAIISVLGFVFLYLIRWKVNLLSLDEEEARSLGVNTRLYRYIVIIAATLMTSAAVSVCGLIGWVGLVVPHITRMLFGPDFKTLLPWSVIIGAAYILAVDTVARTVVSQEIPLGILTSIIGAPFFFFLMLKIKRVWS